MCLFGTAFFKAVFDFFLKGLGFYSAGITLYTLMSILPLFIVITVIISHIALLSEDSINYIFQKLFPSNTESFVSFLKEISDKSAIFGISSFLFAFYFASRIFGALHTGINHVFDEKNIPFKKVALIQILGVPVFILILIFIYLISFTLNILRNFVTSTEVWKYINLVFSSIKLEFILYLITDITKIIDIITFFTVVFLIYKYFIPIKFPLKENLLISTLVALILVLVKLGFSTYISFASKTNPIYGSLSGIFAFIMWIFLTYNVILIGARTIYHINKLKTQNQGH